MNKAAQALGRMAAGKPKRFSAAEIARRTARIQKYNAERKKVAAAGAKTSCPKRKKSNGLLTDKARTTRTPEPK